MMIKRLLCILLSLTLAAAAALALAEDAPAEEVAETAGESVLLVTVNGEEIWSDNAFLQSVIASYTDYAASNGYDTTDPAMIASINGLSLDYTIKYKYLVPGKAAEFGLDQVSYEEKADIESQAKAEWAEIVDTFVAQSGLVTDESTDDDKAAARADIEATLMASYGYDEARYIQEYTDSKIESLMVDRVVEYLTADKTVSDEEVQAYFDDLVKEDRETYENDIGSYEFYTNYYGQSSYFTPEGYRAVTHILLPVEDELLNCWKDLSARLEEQQSDTGAEATETDASEAESAGETPAPEGEAEPTAEPVTQEMVDAAEKAILDSVQPTVDEIMAKLEGGASFEDLIGEYGTDPGMQDDATRAKGYAVHPDSILWDPAFTTAAMELEKIGDVGRPVVSQFGVHILQYLRDIPGGAVELTDEMKEDFRATLTEEMKSEALVSALDQWMAESDIVYTEAGEDWRLPEDDEDESGETEEEPASEEQAEAENANP